MSGHGGFSAIGRYSQPVDGWQEIQRNMTVGEADAPGGSVQPQGTGENAPVLANPRLEASNALIRQLDSLLSRAAESATKGVDAEALKKTFAGIKDQLGFFERKSLNSLAEKADAAYKALNAFNGRQLGRALKTKGGEYGWDTSNPAGAAIKKALDAQNTSFPRSCAASWTA